MASEEVMMLTCKGCLWLKQNEIQTDELIYPELILKHGRIPQSRCLGIYIPSPPLKHPLWIEMEAYRPKPQAEFKAKKLHRCNR